MKTPRIQLDKVRYVVIGSLVILPMLIYYVWSTLYERLQHSETTWLSITITLAAVLGVLVGWFVNPMVAYKRNPDICVGGIPFPVHYGMPVEDGCISGYFGLRNFLLDVCYYCLMFVAAGLLIYKIGANYGFIASLLTISGLYIGIKIFMVDVLKIYPIKIKIENETFQNKD
ncbi:MAG: hypothetical protein OES20_10025 [Gammaproteobacteria bacterium]|nr:hypothetical protein [Gammaproteobacteria bacterium]MDH3858003.1 hypothetical protein [Gammaproteobacteria bacterium]